MPSINLRQVEAFRAVMLTGGMTAAAELLGVTQPAVSRLVREFEVSSGLSLFERRGNQITPTPAAATLLAEVERSFAGLSRIADLAQAIRTQAAGSLRIAVLPALASGTLPRFLGQFLRDRPQVHASVLGMPSHLVVEAVAAGQAEFGYAAGPLERPGFLVDPIPSAAVVALPKGHRLESHPIIQPQDLANERLIGIASGTLFRSRIDTALAGINCSTLIETPLTYTACVLVAEGAGVSIVDPFSAGEFTDRGVVVRPFEPWIESGIVQLRLRQRLPTPLAQSFMEAFATYLSGSAVRHTGPQ
ncbi:LysR family transcriptional regulator [Microvirga pakistanensis]|uniref:LysR family transcriptional regulator n=1 Tax=Microvirga pakistanensis TaxID=1682650 RepID=UPI001FCECF62|nr:LysR family transcriptional regulator [Microvirga pakistanensis]